MKRVCLIAVILSIAFLAGCSQKKRKCIPCTSRSAAEVTAQSDWGKA